MCIVLKSVDNLIPSAYMLDLYEYCAAGPLVVRAENYFCKIQYKIMTGAEKFMWIQKFMRVKYF